MEHVTLHLSTRRAIAIVLTAGLISLSVLAQAANTIGIAAVASDVEIKGKGEFNINDEVSVGDVIQTGKKGSVTILFNDESMLTLGPNSSASLDLYKEGNPGESRITIIDGNFNYFPGTILEKGGNQTVVNNGATSSTGTEVAITESGLATTIENNTEVLDININELNANELALTEAVTGSIATEGGNAGVTGPNNNVVINGGGVE